MIILMSLYLTFSSGLVATAQGTPASSQENQTELLPLSYQLNALNPEALAIFYEEQLGLSLLEEKTDYYRLGTPGGKTLLEIFPTDLKRTEPTTGLYHTAFLLDDRVMLGSAMAHLLEQKAPLQGYSHHNVSEAAYLADPEGNGIELYVDTPRSIWRYDDDGYVLMGNGQLDVTSLLMLREDYDGFSDDTSVGHFHLAVNNIEASEDFYQLVMGFKATTAPDEQTAFFASGDYHHHLGTNTWDSSDAVPPADGLQGLSALVWQASSQDDLDYIMDQLNQNGFGYDFSEEELVFKDTAGITHIVRR